MRNSEKRTWGIRILFLIGFLLCCIPLLSGVIEKRRQAEAVATYQEAAEKETASFEELYRKAEEYNDMLYQSGGAMVDGMTEDLLSEESYQKQLALSETGIMGSLEIPKINVNLPIYHGTGEEALANGVGHLEGSSLPIGGENTHSVLSGHRGLPSSKLLVRLDEIEEGDYLFVRTGDRTLAYKVMQIQVVEPDQVSSLNIRAGEDLLSIVTCTPYGLNTHRLIVTGKRVGYQEAEYQAIEEAVPSGRELFLTYIPFVCLAIAIGLYIKERRWKYEDGKI